eukprot:gnl/Spiro4/7478_TR3908_c0_g1_i1.p1 gnl/Spiro4/7478_TR3908_c0_g1~~gnl/Spiro4/7478_TR3908_c0_g1_i1.p1  ORF type:complete len:107 (+),score=3.40 gnl/Spiro4/7478_TR3908_c0_g1_i1:45-365(+)
MPRLTQAGKEELSRYEYKTDDRSILTPFLQPLWKVSVWLFPMWVAPNLITLGGLIFMFVNFLVLSWFLWDFQLAVIPGWAHVLAGFSVFMYQTLDAVDGKQVNVDS